MSLFSGKLKVLFGICLGAAFLVIAFYGLDWVQLRHAFGRVHWRMFVAAVAVVFLSHLIRALRWKYLLNAVKPIPLNQLFSALLIGYFVNGLLPAHLGEIARAGVAAGKGGVRTSTVLGTILLERIIDALSLFGLIVTAMLLSPLPDWVEKSGYVIFISGICMLVSLVVIKSFPLLRGKILALLLKPLPGSFSARTEHAISGFCLGIRNLKRRRDWLIVLLQTCLIWICYWAVMLIGFHTLEMDRLFTLGGVAALVCLVTSTIGVAVPSSPGYVGTYHLLCQISLIYFGVPREEGLAYGIVVHAINFLPVTAVGFMLTLKEGLWRFTKKTGYGSKSMIVGTQYKDD